ncbi:MAG: HD domain-containing protein [Chloroflexota bacterium]
MRVAYRVRQFWNAVAATPNLEGYSQAQDVLSPQLMALFLRLQASEQAHSLGVFRQLRQNGFVNPDLLAAALLHDIGKSCYPLNLWERVLIVLVKALLPQKVKDWGQSEPRGWKRPFVVAEQHPDWGAALAADAGASPRVVSLIRQHQDRVDPVPTGPGTSEDHLLFLLQQYDNES